MTPGWFTSVTMESLENRAGEDMSATAANANMSHVSTGARIDPFPGVQASTGVRIHTFANQQQSLSVDTRIHTFASQEHVSCGDMGVHELVTQHQPITPHGQVMTDEQMETLRRQISVYATICQQLVEMHKAMMAQQGSAAGLWLSPSLPFDSSLHHIGHKLTSRQRWTPSQTQLHILERLFEQESGTPNKQRIKEITTELSQHGQISETNVYNWFQNRRARTKRKQQLGGSNNGDSELDTDVDLPEEKKGEMQANPLVDDKLWDLPRTLTESKTDFSEFSASREFQGRPMIITGAVSHH